MARLIGLTGMAGAGKDEAARALVAVGWKRDAFADRMRTAMLALDPWVDLDDGLGPVQHRRLSQVVARLGWDEAKRTYPEVRRLLQKFGTEAGREIHGPDVWVELVLDEWIYPHNGDPRHDLVVTDCRFENEAAAIRACGGLVVRIERPGVKALPGGHASEAGIPDALVDRVIVNDGTITALHKRIREIAGPTP